MTAPFALRAPDPGETAAVAALLNAHGHALHGAPAMSEAEMEGWFTSPSLDRDRDIRVAAAPNGSLLGYADIGDQGDDGTRLWIDLRVHPGHTAGRVAEALLDAMEARAREKAAPTDALLRAVADERDEPLRRLLESRGYRFVRASFRMALDFREPPPEPSVPAGIAIRTYRPADEGRAVYDVVGDSFRDTWDFMQRPYDEFVHWSTTGDFDPALWWVAVDGEEFAGVCLCHPSAHGDETRGWVSTRGVRRAWRGRGLGLALLLTAFGEFHRRGLRGAELGVDAESPTGAVHLYERAGMHVARRNDIFERRLG